MIESDLSTRPIFDSDFDCLPGRNVSRAHLSLKLPKRKKGVVSLEKDMIFFHILLEGNDPFFAFGRSRALSVIPIPQFPTQII